MRTCRGSEGFPIPGGGRLTAEGVNPSSRSVFEKSVRENCFLDSIRQRKELPENARGAKEPWEVHGEVHGLNIDAERLTGQILRNFS